MGLLPETALDFAREHIRCFYASDFFPDADEYGAVWAGWDLVVDHFKKTQVRDIGELPEDMACAKASGGFRLVHQLHPLASLAYTGLAGQIAPLLEPKRVAESKGVACSYRIDWDPSGRFFKQNAEGFETYRTRSIALSEEYEYVLLADIAGFYNHIYVHRVESAVEKLDSGLEKLADDMHRLLLALNEKTSIGIPVGPAASIVISELVLNEIDQFLMERRPHIPYTRYADDFRFFWDSRTDLEALLHDLSQFLYRSQRLTLANAKTRILSTSQFRDEVLFPPANAGRAELAGKVGIAFADFETLYDSTQDWLDASDFVDGPPDEQEKRDALTSLFEEVIADNEVNIGLARQVLRRARSLHTAVIARPVVESLNRLAPLIRDVGLYLDETLGEKAIAELAPDFESFFKTSTRFEHMSHLHYWLAWVLSGKPAASELAGFEDFLARALPRFRGRMARTQQRPQWVRSNRPNWKKWGTWDRWSLLYASELLAASERRPWMDSVSKSSDLMDRLVARQMKNLNA